MPDIEELEKRKESNEQLLPENLEEIPFKPLPAKELERIQKEDESMVAEELPRLKAQIEEAFNSKGKGSKEGEPVLRNSPETKPPKKLAEEVYDVRDVQNLGELYKFLDAERYVTGNTGREYSAKYVKSTIEEVRAEVLGSVTNKDGVRNPEKIRAALKRSDILKRITTAGGLQDKVVELIIKEGE